MALNTKPMTVGPDISGPTLTGSDDEVLIQALRNLWPILGAEGRKQAIKTANNIKFTR